MHKVTLQTCAEFLVAAYTAVGQELLAAKPQLTVWISNEQAPTSFDELRNDAAAGLLYISEEHSENSIYGVAGNTAFRTMHDLGHLSTGLSWTCADEVALALHQWEQIRLHIPRAGVNAAKLCIRRTQSCSRCTASDMVASL